MKLTDIHELKKYLSSLGFRPKDYMGQNFLIDSSALEKIVSAADLKKSDTVLEVGPGLGVLTFELAKKAEKVIAVEKDERLVKILSRNTEFNSVSHRRDPESSSGLRNVIVINQDILKFNLEKEIKVPFKVVANIPYYLTSHLIQYFFESKNKPKLLVLMVQKEVGERIVAQPGEFSVLGISVQIQGDAQIVASVPKQSFWPQPEVDSVILKIIPKNKYQIPDQRLFFRIVKIAFSGKRKQIHNTLASGLRLTKEQTLEILKEANISAQARPQELSIEEWVELYELIADSL